jgi:hypothetical protein
MELRPSAAVLKALLVALWNRTCGAIVLAAPQKSSRMGWSILFHDRPDSE